MSRSDSMDSTALHGGVALHSISVRVRVRACVRAYMQWDSTVECYGVRGVTDPPAPSIGVWGCPGVGGGPQKA